MTFKKIPFNECYKFDEKTGCWIWTRQKTAAGYGLKLNGRVNQAAHRMSWEIHRGTIPSGLNVLHKCDTPACVNPDHLFLGNQKDNVADAVNKGRARQFVQRSHCKYGHPMTPDNIYSRPDNGYRYCRQCMNEKKRKKYWADSMWLNGLLSI